MATFPSPTLQNLTVEGAATVTDTIAASNFSGSSSGTNTGDQTITLTGDVTGSGTGSFTTALAAVGVAGTYGSAAQVPVFTTDAKGRVIDVTLAAITAGVSSVGLVDSTGLFTVTGSPVTSAGNLTLSALASQAANVVLAAPNGAAGAPTFRLLATADIPSTIPTLAANNTFSGNNTFVNTGATIFSNDSAAGSSAHALFAGHTGANDFAIVPNDSAGGYNPIVEVNDALLLYAVSGAGTPATGLCIAAWGGTGGIRLNSAGDVTVTGTLSATAALKGSNFNTGLAPSSLTAGASPWTWQNTNAYGVFFCIYGALGSSGAVKLSANNSTYFQVAAAPSQIYVPPGFYVQVTYSLTPPGVTIVPI